MSEKQAWEERYQGGRVGWERGVLHPALEDWLARELVPGPRVLVPSCGRSPEVAELARRGYEVTGLELAPSAVRDARAALESAGLSGTIVETDLFAWEPEAPFDALYEQTSLCAFDPARRAEYEERCARWLRPGGCMLGVFMQSNGTEPPPWPCPLEAMRALYEPARWEWVDEPARRIEHPGRPDLHELTARLLRR